MYLLNKDLCYRYLVKYYYSLKKVNIIVVNTEHFSCSKQHFKMVIHNLVFLQTYIVRFYIIDT